MNTEVIDRPAIEPTTALTLPQRAAVALGADEYELKIKAKVAASADILAVIDPAGREQAHRIGMDLLKLRTGITAAGEAARKDATAFSKAVIGKEKELVALITPEETRVFGLRDAFDEQVAAEKAAKIAKERERMEVIKARIEVIRQIPFGLRGKTAVEIEKEFDQLRSLSIGDDFEEFKENAAQEVRNSIDLLAGMLQERKTADAEAARLEAERAELARLRAENERIANEQAAERQRLADLAAAQELAAKQLRDKAEANLQAERDAMAERMRIERQIVADAQAKAAAVLQTAQAVLDAKIAAHEAAVKLEADHAEALAINAAGHYFHLTLTRDDGQPIMCNPNGSRSIFCDLDERGDDDTDAAADLARCTETAQAMLTNGRSLVQPESYSERDAMIDAADGMDSEPTDIEIIDVYVENFGGTRAQAVARLLAFVGDEA